MKFLILMMFFITSCKLSDKNPMIVTYAKRLELEADDPNSIKNFSGKFKREVFIVENPTSSKSEIFTLIKDNEQKCLIDKKYIEDNYIQYSRDYYKESSDISVNFNEDRGGGFSDDMLEDYVDDFICSISMIKQIRYDGQILIEWKNSCKTKQYSDSIRVIPFTNYPKFYINNEKKM